MREPVTTTILTEGIRELNEAVTAAPSTNKGTLIHIESV